MLQQFSVLRALIDLSAQGRQQLRVAHVGHQSLVTGDHDTGSREAGERDNVVIIGTTDPHPSEQTFFFAYQRCRDFERPSRERPLP